MTKDEKLIISAYTGVLMTSMDELHQFIEQKLGRSVWTHELAHKSVTDQIKEAVKDDFLKLCDDGTNEMELKPCPFCGGTAELKDYTDKIYGFDDYEIRCQCGCTVRSQSTREHYFDGNRYCTPRTEEAKSRALKGLIKLWNEGGK